MQVGSDCTEEDEKRTGSAGLCIGLAQMLSHLVEPCCACHLEVRCSISTEEAMLGYADEERCAQGEVQQRAQC